MMFETEKEDMLGQIERYSENVKGKVMNDISHSQGENGKMFGFIVSLTESWCLWSDFDKPTVIPNKH